LDAGYTPKLVRIARRLTHLACMALFKVNTGTREQEVCGLRWAHEVKVPELDTSVSIIPADRIKNGEERLVVLNRVAKSVIEAQRGIHPVYVFAHARRGKAETKPVTQMNNTGWKSARERAALAWKARHGEAAPDGFRRVGKSELPQLGRIALPLTPGARP
jgi:integrase